VRSGLGMGMCCRCASTGRVGACAQLRGQVTEHREQNGVSAGTSVHRAAASGLSSDLCSLFSDLCRARAKARARGWARAQHVKGIWWMPWHREAMKDVARCEKPRGGASAR
jgi:hypothetical protein